MASPKATTRRRRRDNSNNIIIHQSPIPRIIWIISFLVAIVFIRFCYHAFVTIHDMDQHAVANSYKYRDEPMEQQQQQQQQAVPVTKKDDASTTDENTPAIRKGQVKQTKPKSTDKKIQPLDKNHIEAVIDDMHTDKASSSSSSSSSSSKKKQEDLPEILTMTTSQGNIQIQLRPDLSLESVQYISKLLSSSKPCKGCSFYRAEKPGILQGKLVKEGISPNTVLGQCPKEYEEEAKKGHQCPAHDPNCGCHGPVMTRGMIGWAAGRGGPDFFIDLYRREADWWHNEHTLWGQIVDPDSLDVADSFFELPVEKRGLTFLTPAVPIEIK